MNSEAEMRNVITHAAGSLRKAADNHIGTPDDILMAMAYATGILDLLASYLKVEDDQREHAIPPPDVLGGSSLAEGEKLLSVEGLADWLGVSIGTIYNWNTNGTGPPRIKVGRHVKYRERDVAAWLAQRDDAVRSDPEPPTQEGARS